MALIYACTNIHNKKQYIGITIRTLDARKYEHLKELNSGKKLGIWQEDYNKYGIESFEFSIIEDNVPSSLLLSKEDVYIEKYNTIYPNGYNRKFNGSSKGIQLRDYLSTSKFSFEVLSSLLKDTLSRSPIFTIGDLCKKYSCTLDCIQDILRCKSHTWIQYYFPEDYAQLVEIHESGINRKTYFEKFSILAALIEYSNKSMPDNVIALKCNISLNQLRDLVRGKSYLWAKEEFPKEYTSARSVYTRNNSKKSYTILDTTNNEEFIFTNNSEIATILDIDNRRISDLVTGTKNSICNGRYKLLKP